MVRKRFYLPVLFVVMVVIIGIMTVLAGPVSAQDASPGEKDDASRYDASAQDLIYAADVLSIRGSGFRLKRVSSPHWMRGRENMPNYVSDILETDKDSMACIEFLNGSQLGINKGTKVEIISTAGVRDITQRGTVEKVILKSGTIWAKVSGQKQETFNVETSKGVLGVKGTEFVVESDPEQDEEKVTVLEGEVVFEPSQGDSLSITPGQEVTYGRDMEARVVKRTIDDLRNALNGRFPGLNPQEQAIVSIFTSRLGLRGMRHARQALSVASQTMSLVENPEEFVKRRAISEASSRSPVRIPGGVFGSGSRPKKEEPPKKIEGLSPDGETIDTYYPQFSWDKHEKAEAYQFFVTREPLKQGVRNPGYYAFAQVKEHNLKYDYSFRSLKPGFTYYWSVVPVDKEGKPVAPGSDPAVITMASYEELGVKGLHPAGPVPKAPGEMVFDWTPVAGAERYTVDISTKEDMSDPVITRESEINYLVLDNPQEIFSGDGEYFWRVIPHFSDEDSPVMGTSTSMFQLVEDEAEEK